MTQAAFTTTMAEEIRDAILDDVTDRKGWRQAWDGFDDDIKQEIKDVWLIVINEIIDERSPQVTAGPEGGK